MGRKKQAKCHVGQREIVQALGTDPAVIKEVAKLTGDIADEVKRRAPADKVAPKRRLAKATKGQVIQYDGRPVGVVRVADSTRDPGFFSVFVEYGTKNMAAQPFIRPAAKSVCSAYGAKFGPWTAHVEGGVNW